LRLRVDNNKAQARIGSRNQDNCGLVYEGGEDAGGKLEGGTDGVSRAYRFRGKVLKGNSYRPMILLKREREDVSKMLDHKVWEFIFSISSVDGLIGDQIQNKPQTTRGARKNILPSVMPFQARYKTPTDAVSRKVATKEPSTFELEPCKDKKSQQSHISSKLEAEVTLQITRFSRNKAS